MSAVLTKAPTTAELTGLFRASQFLAYEAKLLDERRFEEWLDLMDDEIVYEVPGRIAKTRFADETSPGALRICDDKKMLQIRVNRLNCGHCWSESPPSRTLRVVGSVMVNATDEPTVLAVESALIIYRQRGDDAPGDIVPVRRSDRIRFAAGRPTLLRRRALITETVLHTPNLGIFL